MITINGKVCRLKRGDDVLVISGKLKGELYSIAHCDPNSAYVTLNRPSFYWNNTRILKTRLKKVTPEQNPELYL